MNEKIAKTTEATLSLAMIQSFMDKVEKVSLALDKNTVLTERVIENQDQVIKRLDKLNGSVAENSRWIDRYDLRVSTEIPALQQLVINNDKKLYAMGVVITVLNICIGYVISLWKTFK